MNPDPRPLATTPYVYASLNAQEMIYQSDTKTYRFLVNLLMLQGAKSIPKYDTVTFVFCISEYTTSAHTYTVIDRCGCQVCAEDRPWPVLPVEKETQDERREVV